MESKQYLSTLKSVEKLVPQDKVKLLEKLLKEFNIEDEPHLCDDCNTVKLFEEDSIIERCVYCDKYLCENCGTYELDKCGDGICSECFPKKHTLKKICVNGVHVDNLIN